MVKVFSLFAIALSASTVLARASHPSHRQAAVARRSNPKVSHKARQCSASRAGSGSSSSSSGNDTTTVESTGSSSNETVSTSTTTSSKKGKHTATTTASSAASSSTDDSNTNSTTSSSSSSSSSSDDSNGSIGGGLLSTGSFISGWTFATLGQTVKNIQAVTLSTNTILAEKNMGVLQHPIVQEDDKTAIHAHFDKGAYELQTGASILGGFSFYSPGASTDGKNPIVDLPTVKASEVSFGYNVKFSEGFQWNLGGKLPGMYGGINADIASTCSGGKHAPTCFSTRMMWRPNGQGELYMYIPPSLNRATLCGKTGTSKCVGADAGVTYGASVGTGNFDFKAGAWTTIRQVIHLNTPGQTDGWAKVFVNGASDPAIFIQNISYGDQDDNYFYGQQMQTFFGGHTTEWASPQDQDIWFADFTMAVTEVR